MSFHSSNERESQIRPRCRQRSSTSWPSSLRARVALRGCRAHSGRLGECLKIRSRLPMHLEHSGAATTSNTHAPRHARLKSLRSLQRTRLLAVPAARGANSLTALFPRRLFSSFPRRSPEPAAAMGMNATTWCRTLAAQNRSCRMTPYSSRDGVSCDSLRSLMGARHRARL